MTWTLYDVQDVSGDKHQFILINGFKITFVASSLPPSPVSIKQMSAGNLAKALNAATVVPSKKVTGICSFSDAIRHSSRISLNSGSEISLPPM